MKSSTVKAIIFILIIVLSEGFEIRNRGKIHTRNTITSKRKSSHRSVKRGRHAAYRRQDRCQVGFGFEGFKVSDLPQILINRWNGSGSQIEKDDVWKTIINPLIQKFASSVFDFAIGDYPGQKYMSDLGNFLCTSIPMGDNQTVGVVGINLTNMSCGTPTAVKLCLMFDQCGTFGLALNAGLASCLIYATGAAATGVGAVVAEAVKVIKSASLAYSYNSKLGKKFKVLNINNANKENPVVEIKDVVMKGHLHAGLKVGLPVPDMKVGDKNLSDLIAVDATFEFLFDFGNVATVVKQLIDNFKKATDQESEITKILKQTNIEFSFRIIGNVNLKFKTLTKGTLPDLSMGLPTADLIFTTGSGFSGLDPGFYFRLALDNGKSVVGMINSLAVHFAPILEFMNLPSLLKGKFDSINVYAGFMSNTKGIACFLDNPVFVVKCYYSYELAKGSCEISGSIVEVANKIFTFLYNAGEVLIIKVKSFFSDVGTTLGVAKEFVLDKFDKSKTAIKNFLTKLGGPRIKQLEEQLRDIKDDIFDFFVDAKDKVLNWWNTWRRKRLMRKTKLRKMRRNKRRLIK